MGKNVRILFLEDLETDAMLVELELRRAEFSFELKRICTKEDFVKECPSFKPDVILSDFSMPNFTGLDALRARRENNFEHIPFILVTGTQTDEVAMECVREGADDYLHKATLSLSRLPLAIENAIQKKATEAMLKQKMAELESYAKEFENFVITASKDLKESLNKIIVFGHRLKEDCGKGLGQKGLEYLERLQKTATRMEQWLDGLLKLFKNHKKIP